MEPISDLETLLISDTGYLEWFLSTKCVIGAFHNMTNCLYGTFWIEGKVPLQQIMAKKQNKKKKRVMTCMLFWSYTLELLCKITSSASVM